MKVQYNKQKSLLERIFLLEIIKGLALTFRKLFAKPITRQYPDEKPPIPPGFRGQHALVRDGVTGGAKCVACLRCATVCPSRCIKIRYHDDEQTGARVVERYEIEALRCVYCGFCAEVCPVNAIVLTEVFEYAAYDPSALYFDQERLLDNWDNFALQKGAELDGYVNPTWRPRGLPKESLAAAKRVEVPPDWTIEGQYVGRKWSGRR
ncbi:MAG: NADH-quinone oxidoreductase subunit NuoI [Desulfurivibrio sp.]